jgi:hypothetical protein
MTSRVIFVVVYGIGLLYVVLYIYVCVYIYIYICMYVYIYVSKKVSK